MLPQTNRKYRVGIAGYGIVGRRRRHYVDLHPDLVTVAVSDCLFKKVERDEKGADLYPSYDELLQRDDLDILFVCLPNRFAPDATKKGLERGLHVFCEKPPGRSVADIESVIACEQKYPSLKLKYGFNHRYHHSVREALQVMQSNELGKVINIRGVYGKSKIVTYESTWRSTRSESGGGILLDQGIHMIDLLLLFVREDFDEISSFVSNQFWGHDVEDNAYALMRTKSGVVALVHSSATQWRHRFNIEICMSKGSIILSGILSGSKSYSAETITISRASEDSMGDPLETTTRFNKDESWQLEIAEFVESIKKDTRVVEGSSRDALRAMTHVFRIYNGDKDWKAYMENFEGTTVE